MASSRPRVYVDADIFASVLKAEPTSNICMDVLAAAERKDIQLIASRLLPVEIAAYKGGAPGLDAANDLIAQFLDSVEAEWVELDLLIQREAARLSWAHQLRASDAIHFATALRRNANHFMALDQAYPHGQVIGGMLVGPPRIVWDPILFDGGDGTGH